MKSKFITLDQRRILDKRGIIESTFDLLKSVCDVDHSRHRSPINALSHLFASLIAYQFMDNKPSIIINNIYTKAA